MRSMEQTVPGKLWQKELYNYAVGQPDIPDVEMSFSNANVTAYVDGNQQRTEEITFQASSPADNYPGSAGWVKLHNVSTGKTSAAGASVTNFRRHTVLSDRSADTDEGCVRFLVSKGAGKHYKRLFCL